MEIKKPHTGGRKRVDNKLDLPVKQRKRYALQKARKQFGWSLEVASNKLNVSPCYLAYIESGRRQAEDSDFWVMAENIYGVPKEILKVQGVSNV